MNDDCDQTRPVPAGSAPSATKRWTGRILAVGLTLAVAGVTTAGTSSAADLSSFVTATTAVTTAAKAPVTAEPSEGGATGIVTSTSPTGFTFSTATGVQVTVSRTSATTYLKGTRRASASAVKKGASVLVLGTVDSAAIKATRVVVQPGGDGGAAAAKAAGVIPFQQGTPSPAKSVGTIPSDYTEGEGTIVNGTAADKATKAAQARVPGGVVNRVVRLSSGVYEVHNISVNWPHHIFVSKDFKVLGYE
ncbi:hypothetical protein ACIQNU_35165 [Streptomyces sp. NPDC091292]|uniref:hypothetical protein n=1 Tax=Streptomyces sp. NPDC091292 TaxID=3365991 RepID=UPI003830B37E